MFMTKNKKNCTLSTHCYRHVVERFALVFTIKLMYNFLRKILQAYEIILLL